MYINIRDTEGHNSHLLLDWSNTQLKQPWPEEMYEAKKYCPEYGHTSENCLPLESKEY